MAVLPETTQALNTLEATLFPAEPGTLEAPDDRRLAELGHAALVAGDFALAETYLIDALALDPDNVRALLDLGVLYRSTGREALARELDGAVLAPGHNGARLADIASRQPARLAAAAPAPDGVARETAQPAPTVTVAPIDDHAMPEMAAAPRTAAAPAAALEDWFAPDTSTARSAGAPPAPEGELGVHLASFRTPQRARRGWKILREAHGDVLANLAPRVARLDLGKERGVFFQLGAVPVPDVPAARALCSELKRREIYCAPKLF